MIILKHEHCLVFLHTNLKLSDKNCKILRTSSFISTSWSIFHLLPHFLMLLLVASLCVYCWISSDDHNHVSLVTMNDKLTKDLTNKAPQLKWENKNHKKGKASRHNYSCYLRILGVNNFMNCTLIYQSPCFIFQTVPYFPMCVLYEK